MLLTLLLFLVADIVQSSKLDGRQKGKVRENAIRKTCALSQDWKSGGAAWIMFKWTSDMKIKGKQGKGQEVYVCDL